MALLKGKRLKRPTDCGQVVRICGYRRPIYRGAWRRWALVGTVGLALGIYSVVVSTLPQQWALLSLLAVLVPFVAMILGRVRRLLLAAILLDIPLQIDRYYAYRESSLSGAIPGLAVSLTTVSLAILYALWLAELLAKPLERRRRPLFQLMFPVLSYLALATLSIVAARDVQLSLYGIFLLVQMVLLVVYIAGTVRTVEDVTFIMAMLLIGLALESLIMVGLRLTGYTGEVGGVLTARIDVRDGEARVGGTVGGPNGAAAYLSLMLAPALSALLTRLSRTLKWLAAVAFGLGVIALILTLSRGGWLAFGLSIAALCFFAWRRGWLSLPSVLVVSLVALPLVVVAQESILSRLLGDDRGAALARIPLMKVAYHMIVENLAFGVGVNNFTVRMAQYATVDVAGFWSYAVHNNFMLIWSETGTAALLAYLAFLSATIWRGWKCWLAQDRLLSPLALGFTVAIAGHMVHMFFDLFNGRGPMQALWFNAGLITAMFLIHRENNSTGQMR